MINKVFVIAIIFFIFHVIGAIFFELIDDEVYYNLWSTSLSLGYYDHPPMIAWWIYLGKFIFGSTTLGVRFLATLSFLIVSLLVGRITFLVAGRNHVVLSVILFNITMPIMGLAFISTPDAPLLLFWTSALWAIIEGLTQKNPWYWLLVGIFAALAVLSKYNALFFILGLFGWCIFTKEGREAFASVFIWIGALIGLFILSPHVLWNFDNHWLGFEKQFSRLLNDTVGLNFFFEFLISIFIFATPLLLVFSITGIFKSHRFRNLLLWVYLPSVLYFLNHSLTERIQGNWLIIFFPWIAIMGAVGLHNVKNFWRHLTVFSGLILTTLILALGLNPKYMIFSGDNPFNQMKGWHSIEKELLAYIDSANWIAVSEYAMVGRISWLKGENNNIWAVNEPYRYQFRGSFPTELCKTSGIFIEKVRKDVENDNNQKPKNSSDIYLSRSVGGKEIMSYKIKSFSEFKEGPYC